MNTEYSLAITAHIGSCANLPSCGLCLVEALKLVLGIDDQVLKILGGCSTVTTILVPSMSGSCAVAVREAWGIVPTSTFQLSGRESAKPPVISRYRFMIGSLVG